MIDACFSLAMPPLQLEVELQTPEGSTLAVVGPNGAGKTTILRALAGLVAPVRGRIHLDGRLVFDADGGIDIPPERRNCGVVFQNYALFPHLPAVENVAYPLRARRISRDQARREAQEWLSTLQVPSDAWNRKSGALSGGQQQRVALARALATGAPVLLLDEPFSALDVHARESAHVETLRVLRQFRKTTVLVTHDMVEARLFGDRIAVLEEGRITQIGPPEELLRAPQTPFIARLAGVNLLRAVLGADAGGGHLREAVVAGLVFHVLTDEPAGEVLLAFRPSEVTLSREAPSGSARNVFGGTVSVVRATGDRWRVLIDAGGTVADPPTPIAAEVTDDALAALSITPGSRVYTAIKATVIETYR